MSKEHEHPPSSLTFETITEMAKDIALAHGQHIPTLIVEGSIQNSIVQWTDIPETHEDRIVQMFLVSGVVAQGGEVGALKQYFSLPKAGMNETAKGNPLQLPPSQDPNRKEALVIARLQAATDQLEMRVYEMLRNHEGHLTQLQALLTDEVLPRQVDSPLLRAFARGFQMGS